MIKGISDVNDKLMDLNKKNKDINKDDELQKIEHQTNNLFVGTTTDLQRLLQKERYVVIDAEPEQNDSYLGNINVKRDGVQHNFTEDEVKEYVSNVLKTPYTSVKNTSKLSP